MVRARESAGNGDVRFEILNRVGREGLINVTSESRPEGSL